MVAEVVLRIEIDPDVVTEGSVMSCRVVNATSLPYPVPEEFVA